MGLAGIAIQVFHHITQQLTPFRCDFNGVPSSDIAGDAGVPMFGELELEVVSFPSGELVADAESLLFNDLNIILFESGVYVCI